MLITNSKVMHPLAISVGLSVAASSFAFNYNDIDENNYRKLPVNDITMRHFDIVGLNTYSGFAHKYLFEGYLKDWKINTMFLSNSEQIINDSNFMAIVNMGDFARPFIIEELEKEPSLLVWSLNLIYNKKISIKRDVSIEEACKLWVKELKR